jgi:hypothetical protein
MRHRSRGASDRPKIETITLSKLPILSYGGHFAKSKRKIKVTGKLHHMSEAITLQIPGPLFQRLANTAQATHRPIEEVVLHSLKVGSSPTWDNVPEEFQPDLVILDRLEDEALWKIAHARKTNAEMTRYETLLEQSQEHTLSATERAELTDLRVEGDRFMLCKTQAAAILRWRGHSAVQP